MTRQDAKEKAIDLWDEWKWWLALVVFPLVVWGARSFDESKLSTRRFDRYSDSVAAAAIQREIRDSARYDGLRKRLDYVICREDFTRKQCLRPDR